MRGLWEIFGDADRGRRTLMAMPSGRLWELKVLEWLHEHDLELAAMDILSSRLAMARGAFESDLKVRLSLDRFARIVRYARTRGDLKHWKALGRRRSPQLRFNFK